MIQVSIKNYRLVQGPIVVGNQMFVYLVYRWSPVAHYYRFWYQWDSGPRMLVQAKETASWTYCPKTLLCVSTAWSDSGVQAWGYSGRLLHTFMHRVCLSVACGSTHNCLLTVSLRAGFSLWHVLFTQTHKVTSTQQQTPWGSQSVLWLTIDITTTEMCLNV